MHIRSFSFASVNEAIPTVIENLELVLGFKSKCRVCCISSAQIGDNEISDIKLRYYIGTRMNFAIFPILSENDGV